MSRLVDTVSLGATPAGPVGDPVGIEAVKSFAAHLADYVTAVAGSVALLFIVINGIRFSASNGNFTKQAEARAGLVSAAGGLAIVLLANVVVQLVVAALR